MTKIINVAVLVYPGVEVIDMNEPIDVFVKANRYAKNSYVVYTIAESGEEIYSEHSAVRIKPEYTLENCPCPDILVFLGR